MTICDVLISAAITAAGVYVGLLLAKSHERKKEKEQFSVRKKALLADMKLCLRDTVEKSLDDAQNNHLSRNQPPTFSINSEMLHYIVTTSWQYLPENGSLRKAADSLRFECDHINNKILLARFGAANLPLTDISTHIAEAKKWVSSLVQEIESEEKKA